jgi:Dehydrogenase E1 component
MPRTAAGGRRASGGSDGVGTGGAVRRNLDTARLLDLYHEMARIRAFEETGLEAQEQGLVLGAIHPSIGQEAVATGICSNLRRDDVLLSTHRGRGHTLTKGADATAMMCELFGRAGGTCGGKGGSMHIADFEVGMLGANGVVAANIEIAAGAAHAIKLRGEDRIVCGIFGDGATIIAAPTAAPMMHASEIGVSTTRAGPNSSISPYIARTRRRVRDPRRAPRPRGSRRISSATAASAASR